LRSHASPTPEPPSLSLHDALPISSSLWTWNGPPGCASRTSTLFFLRRNINRPALIRLRLDLGFLGMPSFCAGDALDRLCQRRVFFFAAPEMKSVSEDYVAKQIVLRTIIDVERGIELEVWCDVASETDCRRVFRAALEIDLHTRPLIEVVGISEDCFVFVARVNGSGDHLVMFGVISGFDIGLRIYIQVRRPIDESHGKKKRLFC